MPHSTLFFNQHAPLVLASSSPRRRDFLTRYGLHFDITTPNIEEAQEPDEAPHDYARRMAREKGIVAGEKQVSQTSDNGVILSADTVVVHNEILIGKPTSRDHAHAILTQLNGESHEVITAYRLAQASSGIALEQSVTTRVTFKRVSDAWIARYLDTDEPYDKAGAYSIQGMGTFLVDHVDGSANNVIGLPIECVLIDMVRMGWLTVV